MQLKILSWNVWIHCHFDQVKDFLNTCDADIIGLQEVQSDDKERDIIGYMVGRGYEYVFAPIELSWGGKTYNFGPALFTKHKILSSETYNLPDSKNRIALKADIEIEGKIIHVFNTHLVHTHQQPDEIQESQADSIIQLLPKTSTIVMGDFNANPESVTIQKMREVMLDSKSASLPTVNPDFFDCKVCDLKTISKVCLDYIFTSKDIKAHSFQVYPSAGSDHLAISTTVDL